MQSPHDEWKNYESHTHTWNSQLQSSVCVTYQCKHQYICRCKINKRQGCLMLNTHHLLPIICQTPSNADRSDFDLRQTRKAWIPAPLCFMKGDEQCELWMHRGCSHYGLSVSLTGLIEQQQGRGELLHIGAQFILTNVMIAGTLACCVQGNMMNQLLQKQSQPTVCAYRHESLERNQTDRCESCSAFCFEMH